MSVIRVTRSQGGEYAREQQPGSNLAMDDLVELIRLGHEIEVVDDAGQQITKDTLVRIALHTTGRATSDSDRATLSTEDEFTLHQLIEDDEVTGRL